jgi:Ca2+-binding EF-hand superfamily protein
MVLTISSFSVAFAEFDLNNDGKITFGEWILTQTMEGGNVKALADHWTKFDWEGKGYLTFQEAYERKA